MGSDIPGGLALWFALFLNILYGFAFFQTARGERSYERLAKLSYHLFTVFSAVALAYLFYLFFSHNYAFKYVYEYNERSQPFLYILSGLWGGQEGTYLLWLFFSALCGYLIFLRGGQYRNWAMVIYSLVNLFFLVLLVKVSPFALLPFDAADGLGLNPLLRDPWMVIHPPVIFMGYAMAGVPFAIVMAALIRHDYSDWIKRIFPWVAVSVLMIGAGNILGGYWAYKTLGWGGYWAWDPVENSSLVPWVIGLALLHGLVIGKRTGALKRTNILMSAFLFVLVIYGTYLTRSGILSNFSVHSFADSGINTAMTAFMAFYVLLTLVLFFYRVFFIRSASLDYNFFGKEFTLFTGMVVLFIFGVMVLFWSSLPILTSLFSDTPRAADIPTYNNFALPLATIMALFLTVSPFLSYTAYKMSRAWLKVPLVLIVAAGVGYGLFYTLLGAPEVFSAVVGIVVAVMLTYQWRSDLRKILIVPLVMFVLTLVVALLLGVREYAYLLFLGMAAMAIVANIFGIVGYLSRWTLLGGHLAHFGFGLMLIGVLASSAYDSNQRVVAPKGEDVEVTKYNLSLEYQGMQNDITHPNNELLLTLNHRGEITEMRPELYYSERLDGIMRKPFIDRHLLYDLYFAPEQIKGEERPESVTLAKGETRRLRDDLSLQFLDFEMGQHGGTGSEGLQVLARLRLIKAEDTTLLQPALVQDTGPGGEVMMREVPATFMYNNEQVDVSIDRILADQGAVVLRIPQLLGNPEVERLVMDISEKPLIMLVWIGTTLILLGSLIVVIRRSQELVQLKKKQQVPEDVPAANVVTR
jgi:cytochrome c-type biogenesis protein CcmF